jgi:cytoskeletal protein CcmA (bactofilin family)
MKRLVLLALFSMLFNFAKAYRIEWGRVVTISTPIHEDLYIAGGTVTINAPIYGDVIIAGGTVTINDTITNDLLLVGGNVTIRGYVADDIRCAGGELHILKNVGGDLVISGGTVEIAKEVFINGGLITGGGNIVLNGTVNGDVRAAAGNFTFNGIANKNFDCRADRLTMNGDVIGASVLAAREILIQPGASFSNSIRYWSKTDRVDFKQSIKSGNAVYDPSLKIAAKNWYYLGNTTALGLVWYLLTVFSFILLIQFLFANTFRKAGHDTGHSLLKSLGLGLLFFIGVPVAIVLLLTTIIGVPIGLILMATYVVIVLLATVIAALVFANWYNEKFGYNWGYWKITLSAMAMFILFKLISFTPFLGWLIMIVIACIAFGALIRNIDWKKKHTIAIQ